MAEQFSLFGDPEPKTLVKTAGAKAGRDPYSLFFSLFPAPDEAVEIAGRATALLKAQGLSGKPLLPHRLHVTCHVTWATMRKCRRTWWTQPSGLVMR